MKCHRYYEETYLSQVDKIYAQSHSPGMYTRQVRRPEPLRLRWTLTVAGFATSSYLM